MRVVESLRARPWLAAALAGVVVGCVIGLFLPIRAAAPSKAEEAPWQLPSVASIKRFDETRYQAVRSARFWGEIKSARQGGAQASPWTLNGVVTRPSLRIAVTSTGAGKPQLSWVPPGGKLPDGGIFVAVDRDTVIYERDGCRRARRLYEKPSAAGDACIGDGKPAPAPEAGAGKAAAAPASPQARNLI